MFSLPYGRTKNTIIIILILNCRAFKWQHNDTKETNYRHEIKCRLYLWARRIGFCVRTDRQTINLSIIF